MACLRRPEGMTQRARTFQVARAKAAAARVTRAARNPLEGCLADRREFRWRIRQLRNLPTGGGEIAELVDAYHQRSRSAGSRAFGWRHLPRLVVSWIRLGCEVR